MPDRDHIVHRRQLARLVRFDLPLEFGDLEIIQLEFLVCLQQDLVLFDRLDLVLTGLDLQLRLADPRLGGL